MIRACIVALCIYIVCSAEGGHLHPEMVSSLPGQARGTQTVQLEDLPIYGVRRRAGPAQGKHMCLELYY